MVTKVQTIYLDEAGFTGNNLLDPTQPICGLSCLALSLAFRVFKLISVGTFPLWLAQYGPRLGKGTPWSH